MTSENPTGPNTPGLARTSRRALCGVPVALAATLALAACSSGTSSTGSSATTTATSTATPTATSMASDMGSSMGSSMGSVMGSAMASGSASSMPSMSSSMASSMSSSMESDGGPAPAGITVATNPKYPVGSTVILLADHMPGMKGATATVVGAYKTYTYAVTYTTAAGVTVTDHKWVVQQEIKDAGAKRLANGTKVVLTASHMTGMYGATATIVSSTDETVYMVDYSYQGMTMRNHKWVVESEMKAA